VPTLYIDNLPYQVDGNNNLLQQCLSLGFDLPYFCWHPALGSVGSCRQCAVTQFKDEKDDSGKIVMACMTPVEDGMRIAINDQESTTFRSRVIEWLMTSHPHDCPVCDEGGECHLQDMTVMTGHTYRRYRFNKRTFNNQELGPFINHEMNRCITCYRCVRFYDDYAGGRDLQAFASRNQVYFGRHQDGALENNFSGNLVEVCPTGVFTDKTLKKHYTRKWDLQNAPSVCMHCAAGCNIIAGERYGSLRQIRNRYNGEVNGYFICDRGRFGYEFVNSDRRTTGAWLRETGSARQSVSGSRALQALRDSRGHRLIGIGSPRASLESNFALRSLVGADNFYDGVSANESRLLHTITKILQHGPVATPTLTEIEQSDAVLILGEDIANTAPRIALACRQAVRQKAFANARDLDIPLWMDGSVRDATGAARSPMFVVTPDATPLDDIASALRLAPADIARLGFAVAHALDANAPAVDDAGNAIQRQAQRIAEALQAADRPMVISGTGCVDEAVIQAAANVANALSRNGNTHLYFAVPECNNIGLALLNPKPLADAFQTVSEKRQAITAIVLENDLYRRAPKKTVDDFAAHLNRFLVIDHLHTPTAEQAQVTLPVATFAQATGTVVSAEGRAQRFFPAMPPENGIAAGWQWIANMFPVINSTDGPAWQHVDELTSRCASEIPALSRIVDAAPSSTYRKGSMKIPRSPHRYSGRTAEHAAVDVHEPQPPQDGDSPLAYSMEGAPGEPPAALIPFYWSPGWNSVQASNKYQSEVGGTLEGGDPGVRLFTAAKSRSEYFLQIPAAFQRRDEQQCWLIPLHHIFGSEELSAFAGAINQRAPQAYVALNEQDAQTKGIAQGDTVNVSVHDQSCQLPCHIHPSLPPGVVGIPTGLRDLANLLLPAWGVIQSPATEEKRFG
jgi:NADH-quinone oxidoreductase subunit G